MPDVECDVDGELFRFDNGTCYNSTEFVGLWNYTIYKNVTGLRRLSASEEYYK